jgi:hypothetical protein
MGAAACEDNQAENEDDCRDAIAVSVGPNVACVRNLAASAVESVGAGGVLGDPDDPELELEPPLPCPQPKVTQSKRMTNERLSSPVIGAPLSPINFVTSICSVRHADLVLHVPRFRSSGPLRQRVRCYCSCEVREKGASAVMIL